MDLAIDTSALMAVLLGEPSRAGLLAATREAELFVPPSVRWEMGNAVVSLIRRRRLSPEEGDTVLVAFEKIPLRIVPVDIRRAARLANDCGLYAYDGYILEAARSRGLPLVTLDAGLRRAAEEMGMPAVEVLP